MEETLKILDDAKDDPTLKIVKECPLSFLREVKEDGSDVFIGSLALTTCIHGELMGPGGVLREVKKDGSDIFVGSLAITYGELMGPDGVDWENKKKLEDENNSLKAGDARIVWCFGGKPWLTCITHRISIHYQITWLQVIIAKGL
jgi:hypothetical protein